MEPVRLTLHPNGPLEISGAIAIVRPDGTLVEPVGTPAYLCRCGRSASKPFCDGSHHRTGWTEDACPTA